jgi:hypothetical protein
VADRVRIVAGELREDAGAVGAAALILREAFAAPTYSEAGPGTYRGTG